MKAFLAILFLLILYFGMVVYAFSLHVEESQIPEPSPSVSVEAS